MIYFIHNTKTDLIKIGFSNNLNERFAALRRGNKSLSLIGLVANPWSCSDRRLEMELHHKFREHRANGEWFRPHADLLSYIDNNNCLAAYLERNEVVARRRTEANSLESIQATRLWAEIAIACTENELRSAD